MNYLSGEDMEVLTERQRFKAALEAIVDRVDVCDRNIAFRRRLGWYHDPKIEAADKAGADAWREAARIAADALRKEPS